MRDTMLTIGLTGGIGSGKSAASNFFASLGITIIDADRIAHQITSQGTKSFEDILSHYGPSILLENGDLNRKIIRDTIFKQPKEKQWLEELLHPQIRKIITDQISISTGPYTVVSIPLLAESTGITFLDRVLVIDSTQELQIQRTCKRDHIERQKAIDILQQQASRSERIAIADDIIINNGTLADLHHKLQSLHQSYLSLSL